MKVLHAQEKFEDHKFEVMFLIIVNSDKFKLPEIL